jgi:hypothetical protein
MRDSGFQVASMIMGSGLFIPAVEDRETQATFAHRMRFQFAAPCGATGHAEPQPACRELPCVAVLLVRTGSD